MNQELQCKRCKHAWTYNGKKKATAKWPTYVACPHCHTTVKL